MLSKSPCPDDKRGCRFPSPAVEHTTTADRLRGFVSSGATDQPLVSLLVMLLQAQHGNRAALGALFDRYASLVLGIGLRTLRDRGEAEDLVQEVFLSLCEKVRGFDPSKGSGRTWIVQIAYRRGFDRRAYLFRRRFYDGTEVGHIQNTLQVEPRCEERIADLLTGEQLHAAFEELSEKQRATLEI